MFNKPINDVDFSDIDNLVTNTKLPEGQHLDYKREIDPSSTGKKELVKDLSAFANSSGGFLIIGIDETNGLPSTITGTPGSIGRQRIDEWVNSIVSASTDPKVDYGVRVIELPTDDTRAVVIIEVRESSRKPHMVTIDKRNVYYRRHLDITSAANHQEVRDMFYESQATVERVRNFLSERLLLDERMSPYANTKHSRELYNRHEDDWRKRPHIIYSMIPVQLRERVADPAVDPTRAWLGANSKGYAPMPGKDLYFQHESSVDIEGITFFKQAYREREPNGFYRYTEINTNGYIETGLSHDIFFAQQGHPTMQLTYTIAYAEAFLRFAKDYYSEISLNEEVYYQIAVANIKGYALTGFDTRPHGSHNGWAQAYEPYYSEPPIVRNYDNFKVALQFDPATIDDDQISNEMKDLATQISRAFSVTTNKAHGPDGSLDPGFLQHFL